MLRTTLGRWHIWLGWLIGFGIVAALTTIMALILLPMTSRCKKKRKISQTG